MSIQPIKLAARIAAANSKATLPRFSDRIGVQVRVVLVCAKGVLVAKGGSTCRTVLFRYFSVALSHPSRLIRYGSS